MERGCRILVSGIPRGLQQPRSDGNWLTDAQRAIISAAGQGVVVDIIEIPAAQIAAACLDGIEVALVEGGNRIHYPGELDWSDYQRIFVPSLSWVQLCSTGFSDNVNEWVKRGHAATGECAGGGRTRGAQGRSGADSGFDGSAAARGSGHGVMLTNAPGLHTVAIAESVLAGMLWHAKRLATRHDNQSLRKWDAVACTELAGHTALIVGTGRIGRRVASLCKAFGMRCVGVNQSGRVDSDDTAFDAVVKREALCDMLGEADFVVVALPLTGKTRGLIDASAIGALRHTAFVVNVGRGAVIDEDALTRALAQGDIGGAYLDVFGQEPLPATSPLWAMDNVLLIPHDSHSSPRIGDRMVEIFCANLQRYLSGDPLESVCDIERGY